MLFSNHKIKDRGLIRNATNRTYTGLPAPKFEHGYTFHEHLAEFDLINMPASRNFSGGWNGRKDLAKMHLQKN